MWLVFGTASTFLEAPTSNGNCRHLICSMRFQEACASLRLRLLDTKSDAGQVLHMNVHLLHRELVPTVPSVHLSRPMRTLREPSEKKGALHDHFRLPHSIPALQVQWIPRVDVRMTDTCHATSCTSRFSLLLCLWLKHCLSSFLQGFTTNVVDEDTMTGSVHVIHAHASCP